MSEAYDFGREAEEYAADWLSQWGYEILERNWFYDRAEVDIFARIDNLLVVIEVKARKSDTLEFPEASVTYRKRRQIVKATDAYIHEQGLNLETRFDIMAIIKSNDQWKVEHIVDAFLAFE